MERPTKLRRSMLYVPADNIRALHKAASLAVDCVIYDLEDAVSPQMKAQARENLRTHFKEFPHMKFERAIRINALSSEWGTEDLMCARACMPDAIVLPKVDNSQDVLELADMLAETDAASELQIFAMIETAKGLLNITDIAELGVTAGSRLGCLIVGLNDLVKETRILPSAARQIAHPWLMQILLAGRAGKLDIIDAVYNDFKNLDGFEAECAMAMEMGFDGKSLIHPSQLDIAHTAFMPDRTEIAQAKAIVSAFDLAENQDKGVIELEGKMVERLHLKQAHMLLQKAALAGVILKND